MNSQVLSLRRYPMHPHPYYMENPYYQQGQQGMRPPTQVEHLFQTSHNSSSQGSEGEAPSNGQWAGQSGPPQSQQSQPGGQVPPQQGMPPTPYAQHSMQQVREDLSEEWREFLPESVSADADGSHALSATPSETLYTAQNTPD